MIQGFVGAYLMNLGDESVRNVFVLAQVCLVILCAGMFKGTKMILDIHFA